MRAQKEWVDHPDANMKATKRPNLKLVQTPPQEEPDTPGERAVKSISPSTEIVLALLAQGVLIFGLFLASSVVG